MAGEDQLRHELERARIQRDDARRELGLLLSEHEKLGGAVRNALRVLRTELGAEGAVSMLEAGLVFRVGDTPADTAAKLARLQATG